MHLFSDFPPSLGRFIPWPVALPAVVKDGRTASSDLPGSDPGSILASPSLTRLPLSRRSTLVSPWAHLEEPPGRGRSRHPGPRPFRPARVPSRLQGSIRAPLRGWSVAAGDVPSVFVDRPSTPGDIALLSSSRALVHVRSQVSSEAPSSFARWRGCITLAIHFGTCIVPSVASPLWSLFNVPRLSWSTFLLSALLSEVQALRVLFLLRPGIGHSSRSPASFEPKRCWEARAGLLQVPLSWQRREMHMHTLTHTHAHTRTHARLFFRLSVRKSGFHALATIPIYHPGCLSGLPFSVFLPPL